MRTEEIIKAVALPNDPASLLGLIRDLAEEILALRAEIASLRKAALYSSMPDHR